MSLLTDFIRHTDRLIAFDARFKAEDQTASTLPFYRDRFQALWEEVEAAYRTFFDSCDEEATNQEIASVEEKFESVFATYVHLISRINDLIKSYEVETPLTAPQELRPDNLSIAPQVTVPNQAPPVVPIVQDSSTIERLLVPNIRGGPPQNLPDDKSQASSAINSPFLAADPTLSHLFASSMMPRQEDMQMHSMRVPPCNIEPFEGDYASWPTFRDLFTAVFINNIRLSNVERLFHLVSKTKGEAKDIVSRAPLTNAGFLSAWKQLTLTYENKRALVSTQLSILFNLPGIKQESSSALKALQRGINNCLDTLKHHDVSVNNWDPILVFHCCQRLPETAIALWEQSLVDKTELPTWKCLNDFLTGRVLTLEAIANARQSAQASIRSVLPTASSKSCTSKSHHTKVDVSKSSGQGPKPKSVSKACPICPGQSHNVRGCAKFRAMSIQERWNSVKRYNLCANCLSNSHVIGDCNSTFNCATCHQRHHTWLHNFKMQRQSTNNTSASSHSVPEATPSSSFQPSVQAMPFQPSNQAMTNPQSFHQQRLPNVKISSLPKSQCVLLGTAKVLIHHHGASFPVRALIDSGSEVTCISKTVRKRLGLPVKPINVALMGVNSQVTAQSSQICPLKIGPMNDLTTKFECSAIVLPRITGNMPAVTVKFSSHQLPNLYLADSEFYSSSPIDLLIGGDLYPSIMKNGIQHNVLGSLLAQETAFGWIMTGSVPARQESSQTATVHFTTTKIDEQLRKFWELEEIPKKKFLTPAEKFCEDLYRSTTKRNAEGRYIVRLPFKPEYSSEPALGVSRNAVGVIFRRNEASLLKKPEFKPIYDQVLNEYAELGHMRKVSQPSENEQCFYLPHHPVLKPDSTTTAVRVVFNASHVSANGRSLNDILYAGPALQAELTMMLLNWRLYRYVFSSDITKMYRQILVDPTQTRFQRILFRSSPQEEIEDYELKTVTFGVNCAPFLAIRTLIQLANDVQSTHPLAAKILRHNMYVDDVLAGYNDIHTALRARDELISALKSAGFDLRKWSANDHSILQNLPPDHLLDKNFLEFEESSSSKALGVRWNAVRDEFYFVAQHIEWKESFTKREVLSTIAKLFDPAGWLGPIVIVAKIIMQQIWLDGTTWDAPLKPHTLARWKQFIDNYGIVADVKIPRWVGLTDQNQVEIHGFCDASEKAYAGVLYIRSVHNGVVKCNLFTAKTKVAPVKTISLPRLELCGALLLANMIAHLTSELSISQFKLHCWTDSTIVLAWLQKPPCAWKTFVASRVAKIQDATGIDCWRHVSGLENPADLGSRGTTSSDFASDSLWWNGPSWLAADPAQWPQSVTTYFLTDEEKKPVKTFLTMSTISIEEVLTRFSSYARALRVLSYVLRFLYATKYRRYADSHSLTAEEMKSTRTRIIKLVQRSAFQTECQLLTENQPVSSKSSLTSLNPVLDKNELLRVNGRLHNSASLSEAEKFPIILPYQSHLSRLLIQFIHDISLHGGNRLVLRLLRIEFWIPKAQNLIKYTINRCKTCVLFKNRQQVQLMAALPSDRTTLSRPFAVTGVDFAGPFDIKNYTGRACLITKGYVCVFVCFATKAIHLEITSSLSSECFLAAFARFIARRGCPHTMWSDNGTTFVGASSSLSKEFNQMVKNSAEVAQRQYAHLQLAWKFIPAGAPHMGGLWEAGVKSFKTHFRKIASDFKYTFEEMSTLLCRIEACLNSRPLSLLNDSSSVTAALTPGHFLIGAPLLSPAEEMSDDTPISIVNRWQKLKVLSQHIASRWKDEYLKELHKRTKWKFPSKNLEVNDVVVIRHENLPPTEWRLGRVCQLHPGRDGHMSSLSEVVREASAVIFSEEAEPSAATSMDVDPAMVATVSEKQGNAAFLCKLCKQKHPLRHCHKFKKMTVEHRLRAVVKHRYCAQCFAQSHTTARCTSKNRCRLCKRDHHWMLHLSDSVCRPQRPKANQTALQRPRGLVSRTARETLLPLTSSRELVLLPTCQCVLVIGRHRISVRGMIDMCATTSKVVYNVLQATGLLQAQVNELVELTISSQHEPTTRIKFSAMVVRDLNVTTPESAVPVTVQDRFRDFKLADTSFGTPGPVKLVLGANVYPRLIRPGLIQQYGLPLAQESALGYILSGPY